METIKHLPAFINRRDLVVKNYEKYNYPNYNNMLGTLNIQYFQAEELAIPMCP